MSLREFTTAPPRYDADGAAKPAMFDPLRYCIFTTIALLAWLVGPAIVVAATGGIGVVAYWRARRAGLTRSRCVLGDTRLVMAYLAIACAAGTAAIVIRIVRG